MSIPDTVYLFKHRVCDKLGFIYLTKPIYGTFIRAEYAYLHKQKRLAKNGERIVCEACYRTLYEFEMSIDNFTIYSRTQ